MCVFTAQHELNIYIDLMCVLVVPVVGISIGNNKHISDSASNTLLR
jgi:hypothetical protein